MTAPLRPDPFAGLATQAQTDPFAALAQGVAVPQAAPSSAATVDTLPAVFRGSGADTITARPDAGKKTEGAVDFFANAIGNTLTAVGRELRDVGAGSLHLLADHVAPTVINLPDTPDERRQKRSALAFGASMAVGGPIAKAVSALPKALVTETLTKAGVSATVQRAMGGAAKGLAVGAGEGATFGAIREKHEGESLLGAIVTDALVFGGIGSGLGMFGAVTRPVALPRGTQRAASSPGELGQALHDEVKGLSDLLTATDLPEVAAREIGGVAVAQSPANVGILRKMLGSPSQWVKIGGPVGDAAGRLAWNGLFREQLQRRVGDEWTATLAQAEKTLHKGLKPWQRKAKKERNEQLGRMLDTMFDAEDVPLTAGPQLKEAFETVRNGLSAHRETLRLLHGGDAGWGIDAYLPHVFVGKYTLKDGAGKIRAIVEPKDIAATAKQLMDAEPGLQLAGAPKEWTIPSAFEGTGMSPRAFGRFLAKSSDALALDPDEIAQMVLGGGVVRLKPGKKFFGHALQREANLEGYAIDAFEALRTYGHGFARKVAFHDYDQKATALLTELANIDGTQGSIKVLREYVDRVLGRPTAAQMQMREMAQAMSEKVSPKLQPWVQREANPETWLRRATFYEAFAKLGYSPSAWVVQSTQTILNTSSAIGYAPTIRAIRLLHDKSQAETVDGLLRAMGVEVAVPLAQTGKVYKNIHELSGFHPLYLFNKLDVANRSIAGLAKYQEMIMKGAGPEEALLASKKFITETNFHYGTADTPGIMQGALGNTTFQFKKYFTKEMEFIWSLRKDPKAAARFTANITALGGVGALMSLPPLALANWAVGEVTGETITERAQRMAPGLAYGVPGLAGVDLSGAVSTFFPTTIDEILGPSLSDAKRLVTIALKKGGGRLTPEDKGRLGAQLMPVFVKRIMEGYQIAEQGAVRAGGGKLRFETADPVAEGLLTAGGFRSTAKSDEQRASRTQGRMLRVHQEKERAVVGQVVDALIADDAKRVDELIAKATADGLLLTSRQIKSAYEARLLERTTKAIQRAPDELKERMMRVAPIGSDLRLDE